MIKCNNLNPERVLINFVMVVKTDLGSTNSACRVCVRNTHLDTKAHSQTPMHIIHGSRSTLYPPLTCSYKWT
jgi:hypothetical protein